ncbi:MAG: hypothetical protein DMF91_25780 [Acidobacteria bacterium]|nr:MAG: hypothetical protein DMF91_25780 [Acidobacteriota bacterium]
MTTVGSSGSDALLGVVAVTLLVVTYGWLDKKDLKKCGRFIQFALAGAVSTRECQSDSSSLSLGRPDDWINQLLPPVSRARMAL